MVLDYSPVLHLAVVLLFVLSLGGVLLWWALVGAEAEPSAGERTDSGSASSVVGPGVNRGESGSDRHVSATIVESSHNILKKDS